MRTITEHYELPDDVRDVACILPRQRAALRETFGLSCSVRKRLNWPSFRLSICGPEDKDFMGAESEAQAICLENYEQGITCIADDPEKPSAGGNFAQQQYQTMQLQMQMAQMAQMQMQFMSAMSQPKPPPPPPPGLTPASPKPGPAEWKAAAQAARAAGPAPVGVFAVKASSSSGSKDKATIRTIDKRTAESSGYHLHKKKLLKLNMLKAADHINASATLVVPCIYMCLCRFHLL